jgi:hypothetical protein
MRAVLMHIETNRSDPFVNQTCILARAEMAHIVDAAWEDEVFQRASATVEPGQQRLASLCHQFELHGSFGLLLHDRRPISDHTTRGDIANLHLDDVTPP